MTKCTHLDQINENLERQTLGCEECIKAGDSWERVRICLTCGHVGCDDESKNKHARKHFEETGHPIIASGEPNRNWRWCYIDEEYV
ncbi:MAG: UBP-type zinc finger domain-containing protein [Chloroflexota bacterium]